MMKDHPRSKRGELRRAAMLDAARDLFLEQGYEGTSLADVVARTGGSLTNLYQWFGNKEGLFAAMIQAQCDNFYEEVALPRDIEGSVEDALVALARRAIDTFLTPPRPAVLRAITAASLRFPDIAQLFAESGVLRGLNAFTALLTRLDASGQLAIANPQVAASCLLESTLGAVQRRLLLGIELVPAPLTMEEFLRETVRLFLRGAQA